ncbi:hypothetical protein ACFGVS_00710 [Mucilaginibacter sp. AW1-7]|uniref:hypothetical protein n=1 Tax=Mucilaginibacter sp. AW1-7 TaxID=3349874 RepID=UPI003F73D54F
MLNPNLHIANNFLTTKFGLPIASLVDTARAAELSEILLHRLFIDDGTLSAIHNQRIAVSIAIDFKTGSITPEKLIEKFLNRKDEHGEYIISLINAEPLHNQFHRASNFVYERDLVLSAADLKEIEAFYETEFSDVDHPLLGYVRCIQLPVFFENYVRKGENYKDKSNKIKDYLDDKDWDDDYNMEIDFPHTYPHNNVNMRGGKPLAWIAPGEILDDIPENMDTPTVIAKRLGISVKNTALPDPGLYDVLVAIKYLKGVDGKAFQPAAIHADWYTGGFVGYKENSRRFGLTFNCVQVGVNGIDERIHVVFPIINEPSDLKFAAKILGRVNEAVELFYDKILEETLLRFIAL